MKRLVIIPTYNEIENIQPMIDKVMSMEGDFHLLVVEDGSPDGTAGIVKVNQQQFPDRLFMLEREGKQGIGPAYIAGFKWALQHDYDYIFEMDCDFSHNPDDLLRLYDKAAQGYDVVVGSRYLAGVNVINWPMGRLLLSYFASKFVRTVTRMSLNDATAGFVCYSNKALNTIDLDRVKMKGYGFQVEMKYTMHRLKLPVAEVSIIFTERKEGVSKMSSGIFGEAFFGVLALPFRRFYPLK
ncbi:MAG: polyprenol monophosphomannose synthase [Rikenellaceae bacterium]